MDNLDTYFSTCPEYMIFFFIDQIGAINWRLNHDAADGKAWTKGVDVDGNSKALHNQQMRAMQHLIRFGIEPLIDGDAYWEEHSNDGLFRSLAKKEEFPKEKLFPSKAYREWYAKWKDWVDHLTPEQWKEFNTKLTAKENLDHLLPTFYIRPK